MTERHHINTLAGGGPASEVCHAELQLDYGSHFRLHAVRDMRLLSLRGIAWVTLEREAGETMVCPGEAYVVPSGKTALIGPLHESVRLELGTAADAVAPLPCAPVAV